VPVSLPHASGSARTTVLIPVTVGDLTGLGITAYDFTVSFDPAILEPASPAFDTDETLTGAAGGYTMFIDPAQPAGRLRVGAFGTTPLSGTGVLIYLRLNVLAGAAATSQLNFEQFIFGEGTPAVSTTNGTFMRLGTTAASAIITGRVVTASGRGVSKARVSLTNQNGESRTALTNMFGYYRFEDIRAGDSYIIGAEHKQYRFDSQAITINGNLSEVNLTAIEPVWSVKLFR
jgi:hypothetical protein